MGLSEKALEICTMSTDNSSVAIRWALAFSLAVHSWEEHLATYSLCIHLHSHCGLSQGIALRPKNKQTNKNRRQNSTPVKENTEQTKKKEKKKKNDYATFSGMSKTEVKKCFSLVFRQFFLYDWVHFIPMIIL